MYSRRCKKLEVSPISHNNWYIDNFLFVSKITHICTPWLCMKKMNGILKRNTKIIYFKNKFNFEKKSAKIDMIVRLFIFTFIFYWNSLKFQNGFTSFSQDKRFICAANSQHLISKQNCNSVVAYMLTCID